MSSSSFTISSNAVTGSLLGLLLGALGGVVAGCVASQKQKRIMEEVHYALDARLAAAREFSGPLLTLARCSPRFQKDAFAALASKLTSMIKVSQNLHQALPCSVTPAMASVGTQYEVSVRTHLHDYYKRCLVNIVPKLAESGRDGKGNRDMEPVNRDLKLAHQSLMDAVGHLAYAMEETAKDKLAQALADRESRLQPRRSVASTASKR
jgi:hypothetical protein